MKTKKTSQIIRESKAEEIKSLANQIVKSKKQCNSMVQIFEFVLQDDCSVEVSMACIRAIHKVFCFYLGQNELQDSPKEVNADSAELKLREWLRERYAQATEIVIEHLKHEDSSVKELALCTLMKFLEAEGIKPMQVVSKTSFPMKLFENIVTSLLMSVEDQEMLIQRFQEYLEYDDVRYNFMKRLIQIITVQKGFSEQQEEYEIQMSNLLNALLVLSIPDGNEKLSNFLVPTSTASSAISSIKVQKELFSKLWLAFVKLKLTSKIYRKILVSLPDKVIPYLHNPLVVSDWLISCYDRGGALSLMSLNGLFVLMTRHNLEYPDFYNRLYNIMDNEIFSAKYKARFFHLLDLFLQSLLLPMSTIAAFIKKLSRMALTAPPHGALLIIELVINLLIRHDTCRALIHRETSCSLDTDPYLSEEVDITKCHAVDSSLWEIKSLQKHWHHQVATQALRIEKPLPHMESSLNNLLETGYEQMMSKEIKKSKKTKAKEASGQVDVPTTHISPTTLLGSEDSDLNSLWVLQDG